MDKNQIFHEVLWGRYFEAQKHHRNFRRLADKYAAKADEAYNQVSTFRRTLATEGLDPDHPPQEFIWEATEWAIGVERQDADPDALQLPPEELGERSTNGNGSKAPINKTHAVFLLMRQQGNKPLSIDELYHLGLEAGYDLPKDDIGRVISRQVAREFMVKVEGKYQQTAKGEAFNNFLPRKASVQG
jgi:signal recognition particle subunit SEC65